MRSNGSRMEEEVGSENEVVGGEGKAGGKSCLRDAANQAGGKKGWKGYDASK